MIHIFLLTFVLVTDSLLANYEIAKQAAHNLNRASELVKTNNQHDSIAIYMRLGFEQSKKIGAWEALFTTYGSIINRLAAQKKYEQCEQYLDILRKHQSQIQDFPNSQKGFYSLQGSYYARQKQYAIAIPYYQKAFRIDHQGEKRSGKHF